MTATDNALDNQRISWTRRADSDAINRRVAVLFPLHSTSVQMRFIGRFDARSTTIVFYRSMHIRMKLDDVSRLVAFHTFMSARAA